MNFVFYLHDETSQEQFEEKLLWFMGRYNIVSLNELRECMYEGTSLRNACVLTVDDGWRSTYDVIYPVMKKYNVPFAIFLSPYVMENEKNFWYYTMRYCNHDELKNIIISRGLFTKEVCKYPCDLIFKELLIDEVYDILKEYLTKHPDVQIPRGFMNTSEVLELQSSGLVEIGAHTMIHPILSKESFERSHSEIINSVDRLSEILNKKVTSFAYPNGLDGVDYTERDMIFVREAGIDMAFSVNPGIVSPKTDPLSIPRWGSIARLKCGVLGQYLPSRENQYRIRKEIQKFSL